MFLSLSQNPADIYSFHIQFEEVNNRKVVAVYTSCSTYIKFSILVLSSTSAT